MKYSLLVVVVCWLGIALTSSVLGVTQTAQPQSEPGLRFRLSPGCPQPPGDSSSISSRSGQDLSPSPPPKKLEFQTISPLKAYNRINEETAWSGSLKKIIAFSNPLDEQCFRPEMVCIQPDLEGKTIELNQGQIEIDGRFLYRTTYTVSLSPEICDIYGQPLGDSDPVRFTIEPEPERLWLPAEYLLTLDPYGPPEFPVFTINIKTFSLQLYQVKPSDWYAYLALHRQQAHHEETASPPGRLKGAHQIVPKSDPDRLVETRIDLRQAMTGKTGHVLVVLRAPANNDESNPRETRFLWVQMTNLAADVTNEFHRLSVWVNRLDTGKPVPNAVVTMLPEGKSARVNHTGQVTFQASTRIIDRQGTFLIQKDQDCAIVVDGDNYNASDQNWWFPKDPIPVFTWYTAGDQRIYQPGETVTIKGWAWHFGFFSKQRLIRSTKFASHVAFQVFDSKRTELVTGTATLTQLGGFHCQFTLPTGCHPGVGSVVFKLVARSKNEDPYPQNTTHLFQIRDFSPSDTKVAIDVSDEPHLIGTQAVVQADVHSVAGNSLAGAEMKWKISAKSYPFSPPNWDDYQFGVGETWNYHEKFNLKHTVTQHCSGQLDQSGQHRLAIELDGVKPVIPMLMTAEASVLDRNGTPGTGRASFLVHPATRYVGMRSKWNFAECGQPYPVEFIVTDLEGTLQAGCQIELTLSRIEHISGGSESNIRETLISQTTLLSANRAVLWNIPAAENGEYRLQAIVRDDQNRMNQSEIRFLQLGEGAPFDPFTRYIEPESVKLTLNQSSFQPGETAELTVHSPFIPAEGLLTVSNNGGFSTQRFTMNSATKVLKIPIAQAHIPLAGIVVDLVGAVPRTSTSRHVPLRPAFATNRATLDVQPLTRALSIGLKIKTNAVRSTKQTLMEMEIRDTQGRPVQNAECALMVMDEARWSATDCQIPHPLPMMYQNWYPDAYFFHSRQMLHLYPFENLGNHLPNVHSAGPAVETWKLRFLSYLRNRKIALERWNHFPPVAPSIFNTGPWFTIPIFQAREFRPQPAFSVVQSVQERDKPSALVAFYPAAITNQQGQARVWLSLPENVPRYRVIAIAAAGNDQFGMSETSFSTR